MGFKDKEYCTQCCVLYIFIKHPNENGIKITYYYSYYFIKEIELCKSRLRTRLVTVN